MLPTKRGGVILTKTTPERLFLLGFEQWGRVVGGLQIVPPEDWEDEGEKKRMDVLGVLNRVGPGG